MKKFSFNPTYYYDTFADYVQSLEQRGQDKPAVTAFTRKGEPVTRSYRELTQQVFALREALAAEGLTGSHIAIVSENSYEWLVAYLAVTSGGSVAVCIDVEQSDESICQMLRLADTDAAFVSEQYLAIGKKALPAERLFSLTEGAAESGQKTFTQLCQTGTELLRESGKGSYTMTPDQTAMIAFTSGTSSISKPVMLTHINLLQNAAESLLYLDKGGKVFTHLPFYHTYGLNCAVIGPLLNTDHLYINGNLKTVMRDLQLADAVTMLTVPLLLESVRNGIWLNAERANKAGSLRKLMKLAGTLRAMGIKHQFAALEEIRKKALGSIRIVISGGAALSEELEKEFTLLGVQVLQGYGITECSPLLSVNSTSSKREGSVGYLLPSFESKIVDGEILVRGTSLMPGYYNAPELTDEVMEDGWFKTGDIGHIDPDGFVFITGRKKNLIVFKNGKKISPEKIEELIGELPLVREVVVYGAPSGNSADDIKLAATIYPDPDRTAQMSSYDVLAALQQGIDTINAHLPLYQQTQMINIRTQPFEKTGTKKIKRYKL